MANVQILDNAIIHDLLINLSKEEAIAFRHVIERTLKDFSVGGERQYQPTPSVANRANGQHTLFRPFTSDSSIGAKITVEPASAPNGRKEPLRGVIVLCDGKGIPTGILSSEEVTGYRTSMNAMVPFSWRKHVENIMIFGGGMQALWHTRLILTLRASEVKSITFVNPFKGQIDRLIATVSQENNTRWQSRCVFGFVDTNELDFHRELEDRLKGVDCIFCTTPSKEPLFPAGSLLVEGKRRPFISAIGSWQPDMIEVDPVLLRYGIGANNGYNLVTGNDKGVILTDDREFALRNCGELVQTKVTARDVVELGEIIELKQSDKLDPETKQRIERTDQFVSEGFVIYKSIGVSLTDLAASEAILAMFKKQQQRL